MSENDVVNQCIRWLLWHGCFVYRNNTGAYKPEGSKRFIRYGFKGSPDIVGVTPHGQYIGVECKHGKNKPTVEQLAFGEEITRRHGLYVVAYSTDDLEAIKHEL